jgi:hypothetical protein
MQEQGVCIKHCQFIHGELYLKGIEPNIKVFQIYAQVSVLYLSWKYNMVEKCEFCQQKWFPGIEIVKS